MAVSTSDATTAVPSGTGRPLTVLITNHALSNRAGSELYVRDVALALRRRGHAPIAFSTVLGGVADELRRATVPVVARLDDVGAEPDVIHGHHHLETTMAALHFPTVPIVHFCHGWLPWEEIPAKVPSIVRYVAVDHTCRDRLRFEHGIPEDRISILHNFVDLARFPAGPPRPGRPARALVFNNQASDATYLPAIRDACTARGIALDVAGAASGRILRHPESVLGSYDLVFAKSRAAMEAMACGCAVVLCDHLGLGPLVSKDRFRELFDLNFGIRTLQAKVDPRAVEKAIDRYDAADVAAVAALMREHGDLERRVDELVETYEFVVRSRGEVAASAVGRAGADYLRWLAPRVKERDQAVRKAKELASRLAAAEANQRQATASSAVLADHVREAQARAAAAEAELARLTRPVAQRFRRFVRDIPGIGAFVSRVHRSGVRKD